MFWEGVATFGVADAVDIGLASLLLYAALRWLRRSRATLVALGTLLLLAVYVGARVAELPLTPLLFHGLFGAGSVALVVLFQEELRQGFEELAAWVMGRRDDHRPRLDATDVLVEALVGLARQKTGALVVLCGLQKLDRHLQGGTELCGQLSTALLASLFDPSSDGHDGAVIVEDREVIRFGAHLPLSRNTDRLRRGGTRHCAGLGLSERTDALCLIVSEERGTINYAAHGHLHEVSSSAELARVIQRFYRDRRALAAPRPLWPRVLYDRPFEKAACVLVAAGLWLARGLLS